MFEGLEMFEGFEGLADVMRLVAISFAVPIHRDGKGYRLNIYLYK